MDMNKNWEDLKIFLKVAESGSLNKAAKELNIGQPTISRRIAELEYEIGEKLFIRKNDGVVLTSKGQKLLPSVQGMAAQAAIPSVQGMAAWAHQVEIDSKSDENVKSGVVKITAPPGIAFDYLVSFSKRMKKKYPS